MASRFGSQGFGSWWRRFLGFLIPVLLLPIPIYFDSQVAKCSYVILVTVLFWIVEPVGVPVTALIPAFLFPALGILSTSETSMAMMRDPVLNYMGCFAVGLALEESGLPKRLALGALIVIGTSIRKLVFGVMLVTSLLSMWLNNAAATMAMIPVAEMILRELKLQSTDLEKQEGCSNSLVKDLTVKLSNFSENHGQLDEFVASADNRAGDIEFLRVGGGVTKTQRTRIKLAMLLGITYGASFGGLATLNGSGPNFVLKGVLEELYPEHSEPAYSTWMLCHIPVMVICVLLASLFLQVIYLGLGFVKFGDLKTEVYMEATLRKNYHQLGRFREGVVSFLMCFLVVVWFLRDTKFVEGWGSTMPLHVRIEDATPSVGVALLLFLLPCQPRKFFSSPPLLDWPTFQKKMPWGILMLVGSGFVCAEGANKSGFSAWVSEGLESLSHLSPVGAVFVVCFLNAALTEFMNNMVTTSITLPVLAKLCDRAGFNPLLLLIPATVSSSFAFMFPVSQPSNAIVFQRGRMRTTQMMVPGIFINILSCCVEVCILNTLGVYFFDLNNVPSWAIKGNSSTILLSTENESDYDFTQDSLFNFTNL